MNALVVACPLSLFIYATFLRKRPGLGPTLTGFLHRSIWLYIYQTLTQLDQRFTNGCIGRSVSRMRQHVALEKRPVFLIFFLSLLSSGGVLFIPATWPLVPWHHQLTITLLFPLPYISAYLCNKTGPDAPHIISQASYVQNALRYPYDYKLFHPNVRCETCQFSKLARSKHCSLCGACVARADHHCIWINNCLGRGNYKYYLALLLTTTSLLAYTVQLAYLTLVPQVRDHFVRYPTQHAKPSFLILGDKLGDSDSWWRASQALTWMNGALDAFNTALIVGGVSRSGVGLLALITAPLPAGLLAYHIYLVWTGMTTNESHKWSEWRAGFAEGSAYTAPIVDNDESGHQDAPQWPKRSQQILVSTIDFLPPQNLRPEIKAIVGEHVEWRRCKSFKELDNTYDLGPLCNLMDVLFD